MYSTPDTLGKLRLVVTLALAAWQVLAIEGTAAESAKKAAFSIPDRKQAQSWLWEAPRPQEIPKVQQSDWPRSEEDHFILAKLEAAGLTPASDADPGTWLRRVHFAITGLPPSREMLHEFQKDPSPAARERVVDQLLGSPHFGERWARHWMDLMRYAESRGHEGDYIIANAWHYRDYLIRAFNEDVPYDQFLTEHLAGDLIPRPRLRPGTEINESVLGTGWPFLGEENHSPVDIRQDECERIDNKVDVFSKTFLGLTVSCARCHDHKFDPISSQDYYALSGFMLGSSYRQVRFEAMENNRRMAKELQALRREMVPQLARTLATSLRPGIQGMEAYLAAAQSSLKSPREQQRAVASDLARATGLETTRLQRWMDQLTDATTNRAHLLYSFVPHPAETNAGATVAFKLPTDAKVIVDYSDPAHQPWKVDGEAFGSRPLAVGELLPGSDIQHPIAGVMTHAAARRDLFWNRLKAAAGNQNDSGQLAATARSGQMIRTPTVTLGSGKLHYLIVGKARVYASVDTHLMVEGPLHGQLVRRFESKKPGEPQWVTHDLSPYSGHRVHLEFGPDGDGEMEILSVVESAEQPQGWPNAPRSPALSTRDTLSALKSQALQVCDLFEQDQWMQSGQRAELSHVANWIVRNPDLFLSSSDDQLRAVSSEFIRRQTEIASKVQWESHTAVAWFDGTGVDEHVLVRGKPFKPGAVAPRSMPVAFASAKPITRLDSSGREELAKQLTDPSNPQVARTLVNRVWHHLFGRGIVASVDNFGALGDRPTHPELLDHLAWRFIHEDHWSMKQLIKRLVLTRTYGMSSRSSDKKAEEIDATNRWLHRMPVRRLEGEVIRDALLTVSGRLNPTVGGPPIMVHLTEFIVGRGRPDQGGPLDGDGRRSIYTAMRRNFLPTSMLTFDAPTPFSTVGKRNVTNVPAQSLVLMNDPLFHQQSKVWSERLAHEIPNSPAETKIRWLFESAYSRLPTSAEVTACKESLDEFAQLHPGPEAAQAAWTDLCHALLNANDFIYLK